MTITITCGEKLTFELHSTKQGKLVSNNEFKNQNLVLFYYPKDNTPGCTIEAKAFSDLAKEFASLNTAVFGVSKDSDSSHKKFIEKCDLAIDLLVDENGALADKLGVLQDKSMFGKKYKGIARTTFLLNNNHKVVKIWEKVKPLGHASSVLAELKAIN